MAAVIAAAGCAGPPEAQATTPNLTWAGAERIGVQCIVNAAVPGGPELATALCERVRTLAGPGAPVPLVVIKPGDPALLNAKTVTLLVHGSVLRADTLVPLARGRLLAFTVRPFRVASDNSVLFGSAPRVAPFEGADLQGPAVDDAIAAALAEVLPWRSTQPGSREISN